MVVSQGKDLHSWWIFMDFPYYVSLLELFEGQKAPFSATGSTMNGSKTRNLTLNEKDARIRPRGDTTFLFGKLT